MSLTLVRYWVQVIVDKVVGLLKAEVCGPGLGGEAGVDLKRVSVLGQSALEYGRLRLHQQALKFF
jgi:hypothetical protein